MCAGLRRSRSGGHPMGTGGTHIPYSRSDPRRALVFWIGLFAMNRQVADFEILIGHSQWRKDADDLQDDERHDRIPHDDRDRGEQLLLEELWMAVQPAGRSERTAAR